MIVEIIIFMLIFILALIIAAIPLYLAVKLLGGKTTILKTIFVNIIAGIMIFLINKIFNFWAGFIAFILLLWIYREMFRLKWIKAFLAWILQFIIWFLFYLLFILFSALFSFSLIF